MSTTKTAIDDAQASANPIQVFSLNDNSTPFAVLDSASIELMADGTHPFGYFRWMRGEPELLDAVPGTFVLVRHFENEYQSAAQYLSLDGTVGVLIAHQRDDTRIRVTAKERWVVEAARQELERRSLDEAEPERPTIKFWHLSSAGEAQFNSKKITAPSWAEIARNYPTSTRALLDTTMAIQRPDHQGRLVLWRGEPGTGKTTAIRALARAWSPWCDIHVVTDSERFFDSPEYLMQVMLAHTQPRPRGTSSGETWKLIIAEDADEYLQVGGGQRSGGALGRLLNVSDGLVGDGMNLLILLTTNAKLGRLDPAITRPGRCLSSIEFEGFTSEQASAWLGTPLRGASSYSLAELYQHKSSSTQINSTPHEVRVGAYL